MTGGNQEVSFCDLAKANRDLESTLNTLRGMVDEVAGAKARKECHSERVRQALHKSMAAAGADSVAKAEVMARVDHKYIARYDELESQLIEDEKVLLRWQLNHARLDALRTQISCQKAIIGI